MPDIPSPSSQPIQNPNSQPIQNGSIFPQAPNPNSSTPQVQSVPQSKEQINTEQSSQTPSSPQQQPIYQNIPVQPGPQQPPQILQQPYVQSSVQQVAPSYPQQPLKQPPVQPEEKILAAVSYIPLVAFISFIIKPTSSYIKLHGRQGILLSLLFLLTIFIDIFALILPDILTWLLFFLGSLAHLALFIIGIYSIYQALIGNWWKIPVFGDIAEKIPVERFTKIASEAITGQPVEDNQDSDHPPSA